MIIYYPFTIAGNYKGTYQPYTNTPPINIDGDITQPSDIIKFNSSDVTNVWIQTPDSMTFINSELTVESVSEIDWTSTKRLEYIDSYIRYVGIYDYLTPSHFTEIYTLMDTDLFFDTLSSPSIAYCTREDGIYGINFNDPYYTSNEVSVGLNTYLYHIIYDYVLTLPNGNELKDIIYNYHIPKLDTRISNACKITYKGFTNICWCFGGIEYKDYDISNIGIVPSLNVGGGNWFSEIKLGADRIQARYIVKKNVDENDPTFGLASGEPKPFCIGDTLVLIDTTSLSDYNITDGWTWFNSDYNQIHFTWHLANVSGDVCDTYKNVAIDELFLPFRIIQFCLFENFG